MIVNVIERWVSLASAAAAAFVCLIVVLAGIARGLRRPRGRATGLARQTLRLPVYFLISVLFFYVTLTNCVARGGRRERANQHSPQGKLAL